MGWSKHTLSRFLSFIHASVVTVLGLYVLTHATLDMFLHPFDVADVCFSPQDNVTYQAWSLMFQITYFYLAVDLVLMILMPSPGDMTWLFHHLVGGIGVYLMWSERVFWSLGLFFELTEITTIFLNICWFFVHHNLRPNVIYKLSALLLITLFLLVRIVGGITICIGVALQLRQHGDEVLLYQRLYATIAPIGMLGLNIHWFMLLLEKV